MTAFALAVPSTPWPPQKVLNLGSVKCRRKDERRQGQIWSGWYKKTVNGVDVPWDALVVFEIDDHLRLSLYSFGRTARTCRSAVIFFFLDLPLYAFGLLLDLLLYLFLDFFLYLLLNLFLHSRGTSASCVILAVVVLALSLDELIGRTAALPF
ncbi:hypothetical protein F4778DRAFT_309692 [Xylariomycetidae sp. FL2044]|nr:hypothetical protein F4778DRAFT_309692 [Xylariomycetidae sp. FL2044]